MATKPFYSILIYDLLKNTFDYKFSGRIDTLAEARRCAKNAVAQGYRAEIIEWAGEDDLVGRYLPGTTGDYVGR